MSERREDSLRKFCKELVKNPLALDEFKDAVSEHALAFHINKIEIITSKKGGFLADPSAKSLTLFEKTADTKKDLPPLEFHYQASLAGEVCLRLYPDDEVFSKKELELTECFSNLCFLYFSYFRLSETTKETSMTHFLSGLPNASGYIHKATGIFKQGDIFGYNAYYWNLKGFGLVSQRFGREEGDRIIKRYAKCVLSFVESEDLIGHLGGDNFVGLVKKERTESFLDFLRGVKTYGLRDDIELPINISATVGVYDIDSSLKDPANIISLPAVAMNIAKNVTHQPFCFATDKMIEKISWQKQIETLYKDALKDEEFQVYYQPKVNSSTNLLTGAEELVRWIHNGSMISPGDFIVMHQINFPSDRSFAAN